MADTTYQFPSLDLYKRMSGDDASQNSREDIDSDWRAIGHVLENAKINATVTSSICGPQATRFELQLGSGVPLETIGGLKRDLRKAFSNRGPVMMLLPIPGRDRAGIEIPNRKRRQRTSGDLFASPAWANTMGSLPLMVGGDILGQTAICDLEQAQHLLMAGDDSISLTSLLRQTVCSMIMRFAPADLRLLIFDSQSRDMRPFGQLPHLIVPPVSSVPGALILIQTLHDEMRFRQQQCVKAGVQSLADFNAQTPNDRMPQIVFILDEFAPLLRHAKHDEAIAGIQSLLQGGSRVGIHLILSTRYPYADNLPAEITSAIPWRIASHTNSADSSMLIIDRDSAADLLGEGDIIYRNDVSFQRCLCGEITEPECREITKFCVKQCQPQPDTELQAQINAADLEERNAQSAAKNAALSPMLPFADLPPSAPSPAAAPVPNAPAATANDALKIILAQKKASPSVLMEALKISHERAVNLLDEMTAHEYLSLPAEGTEERTINYSKLPSEAELTGKTGRKTLDTLYAELQKKIAAGDKESRTVIEFNKGVHAIGKKIVEEASEVWMAAEYETNDNAALEISELMYHVLVMMLKKGITLEDVYRKL